MRVIDRAFLFVPADRPERYAKALAAGADQVIVDLEDAVAPENKDIARRSLQEWLAAPTNESVIVRVNGADSMWFDQDCDVVSNSPKVSGVMVPKAAMQTPFAAFGDKPIIALIESAQGIADARAVAQMPQVQRLAFGSIDLALDLGVIGDDDSLLLCRSEVVLASRLGGLPAPIDGVCIAIRDDTAIVAHAKRARRLGFGGVLCIHPAQVQHINAAFAPNSEEIAWARQVMKGAARSHGSVFNLAGGMVDRPVIARAEAILAATELGNRTD